MGYTNYWKFKKLPKEIEGGYEKFAEAVSMFKDGLALLNGKCEVTRCIYDRETWKVKETLKERVPMKLCGGNGFGEPIINDKQIIFNGDGENGLDHETFYVTMDYDADDCRFSFCKTERKPYDTAVCLALLCLKYAFGDDFEFSSDGENEGNVDTWECGWKEAHKIFLLVTKP